MVQAYCVSCKAKETLKDVEHFVAKNGRAMARGHCSHGHTACVVLPSTVQRGKGFATPLDLFMAVYHGKVKPGDFSLMDGAHIYHRFPLRLRFEEYPQLGKLNNLRGEVDKAMAKYAEIVRLAKEHEMNREVLHGGVYEDVHGRGLFDVLKPLAKPLLDKAKKKAVEIAGQLATTAVNKTGDAIKDKIKGRGAGSRGKGIDSVPHKQVVKTMFYGPLGGEGLYLPGSPESRTGYSITAQRPVYKVASPAPAPAQVAHKGRKGKGSGLF